MGHLFGKSSEVSTNDEDNEPLIFHRARSEKERSRGKRTTISSPQSTKYIIWLVMKKSTELHTKHVFRVSFAYFPQNLLDRMSDYTGRKIFSNGSDMHVPEPILIRFVGPALSINFYRLTSVNDYFSNWDRTIKHTSNEQTFCRLRAHLKCVTEKDVE